MPPRGAVDSSEETKQALAAAQIVTTRWINAARDGNHELLSQLLSENSELVDAVDAEFSSTALHEAAFRGHVRVVELLLAGSPELVHDVDAQGRTALHMAAANNSCTIVERLLAAGPCSDLIKAVDCYGKTALYYAHNGRFYDVAERILAENNKGYTSRMPALHYAVMHRNYNLVVRLLAKHPNMINAIGEHGNTVLHVAAQLGEPKMMAILLAAASPALIHASDFMSGDTALHYAATRPEIVAQLLAASPELANKTDKRGHKTMLHWAVTAASVEVAIQLLAAKPDLIDQVDGLGRTPLLWAMSQGRQAFVEMFLARKPEAVHAVDRDGCNILHFVAQTNFQQTKFTEEFIERLVALTMPKNATVHAVNKGGLTPLHCAVLNENTPAINVLQPKSMFDDVVSAYGEKSRPPKQFAFLMAPVVAEIDRATQLSLLRPVLRELCECLLERLNQDVAIVVYEYLGLKELKKGSS